MLGGIFAQKFKTSMGALCYPCGGMAVPSHLFLFQGQDNTAR